MPINFPNLVSQIAAAYKVGKAAHDWLSDKKLKDDFKSYLSELETRRALYVEWKYEDIHGILNSLSEILSKTRELRGYHPGNKQVGSLLKTLIVKIQVESEIIRGCNMHSSQGEFMAYRALLKIRTEMAKVLSIFCGMLNVSPASTDLEQFIMNMAVVKPST
jgi:hypothetical protein